MYSSNVTKLYDKCVYKTEIDSAFTRRFFAIPVIILFQHKINKLHISYAGKS